MPEDVIDDPEADGCELDFTEDADDDETAGLRPLFPDGDPSKAPEWEELFKMTDQPTPDAPEGPNSPRLPGAPEPEQPSEAPETPSEEPETTQPEEDGDQPETA